MLLSLTFASSDYWYVPWSTADVKNNWSLDCWDEEVSSFSNYVGFNSLKSVKNNCTVATIHYRRKDAFD